MRCKLSVINVYCELITWLSIEYEWYFSYRCVLKRFQFSSFCYKDIIYESLSYEMLNVFLSKYISFQGYFNCFVSSVFTVQKDNGASLWSGILFMSAKNYKLIESTNCFLEKYVYLVFIDTFLTLPLKSKSSKYRVPYMFN